MTTILTIIALIIICFDVFMVTPFGLIWIMKDLDENKPCYGVILAFISSIFLMIILEYLKML